jgi:Protein of unknown function (DUF2889)
LRHRRTIDVGAFERTDGLWDIEASLTDSKTRDLALASGVRPQGLPLHELWLRLTVNRDLDIVDVEACSEWVPYPGQCEKIVPAYRELIGLNLLRGFRRAALEKLGGTAGCTHLTELCSVLPTVAVQAFAGDVWNKDKASSADASADGPPPFALGRCHALSFGGEAVQQFYPRWYGYVPANSRGAPPAGADASTHPISRSSNTAQTEGITHEDSRVSG